MYHPLFELITVIYLVFPAAIVICTQPQSNAIIMKGKPIASTSLSPAMTRRRIPQPLPHAMMRTPPLHPSLCRL